MVSLLFNKICCSNNNINHDQENNIFILFQKYLLEISIGSVFVIFGAVWLYKRNKTKAIENDKPKSVESIKNKKSIKSVEPIKNKKSIKSVEPKNIGSNNSFVNKDNSKKEEIKNLNIKAETNPIVEKNPVEQVQEKICNYYIEKIGSDYVVKFNILNSKNYDNDLKTYIQEIKTALNAKFPNMVSENKNDLYYNNGNIVNIQDRNIFKKLWQTLKNKWDAHIQINENDNTLIIETSTKQNEIDSKQYIYVIDIVEKFFTDIGFTNIKPYANKTKQEIEDFFKTYTSIFKSKDKINQNFKIPYILEKNDNSYFLSFLHKEKNDTFTISREIRRKLALFNLNHFSFNDIYYSQNQIILNNNKYLPLYYDFCIQHISRLKNREFLIKPLKDNTTFKQIEDVAEQLLRDFGINNAYLLKEDTPKDQYTCYVEKINDKRYDVKILPDIKTLKELNLDTLKSLVTQKFTKEDKSLHNDWRLYYKDGKILDLNKPKDPWDYFIEINQNGLSVTYKNKTICDEVSLAVQQYFIDLGLKYPEFLESNIDTYLGLIESKKKEIENMQNEQCTYSIQKKSNNEYFTNFIKPALFKNLKKYKLNRDLKPDNTSLFYQNNQIIYEEDLRKDKAYFKISGICDITSSEENIPNQQIEDVVKQFLITLGIKNIERITPETMNKYYKEIQKLQENEYTLHVNKLNDNKYLVTTDDNSVFEKLMRYRFNQTYGPCVDKLQYYCNSIAYHIFSYDNKDDNCDFYITVDKNGLSIESIHVETIEKVEKVIMAYLKDLGVQNKNIVIII